MKLCQNDINIGLKGLHWPNFGQYKYKKIMTLMVLNTLNFTCISVCMCMYLCVCIKILA